MEMSLHTESAACERYKQAIRDHRGQLEALLCPQPWFYLEQNRCLTHEEIERLKSTGEGMRFKVKALVDLVLTKSDITTLSSFCKAVYSKNRSEGLQIFPFADTLGGIPVPPPKKALPQPSDKPTVLWLVSSEADIEKVLSVACAPNGPRRHVGSFSCQEYAITGTSPRLLTLAYPAVQSNTAMTDPVDLLHQLTPRPHFVVMTGTCCANRGEAQLGDVCVVRSGDRQLSLMAELEHKMEIWRMKRGSLVPQGLEPPRSVYQQMVCLARIFTELQLSEVERSQWYKRLKLDVTKPLSSNTGVRRCVPHPETLLQSQTASGLWRPSPNSPLLHEPCDPLKQEARSTMLFAQENHSFLSDTAEPRVVFARASRFKQTEGTAVCSPRVADLYKAALMVNRKLNSQSKNNMPYIAALGCLLLTGRSAKKRIMKTFQTLSRSM